MNSREQWLAERRTGIGGSDAAASLGLDPYRSMTELYLDKTGQVPAEMPDSERMRFGQMLETVIAAAYAAKHQVRVRRRNGVVRHPGFPWMIANVDRVLEGQRVGLECKNTDSLVWKFGDWGEPGTDQVPQPYLFQCLHYMSVLDYDQWHLAALVGGNHLETYIIERDRELEQMMIEAEHAFWQCVERHEPPAFDYAHPNALPLLRKLYPGTNGQTVMLDASIAYWHAVKQEAEDEVNQYQAAVDSAKAHILHAMGENAIGRLPDGRGEYRRKQINRVGYTVEPCTYTDFRFVKAKEPKQ
jgi:putative phage-type endonuclease